MSDWSALPLVCPRCLAPIRCDGVAADCTSCAASYPVRGGVLDLSIGRQGVPAYDPHYFATLEKVEESHFWFVARREVILAALRRAVPDLDQRPLFDIGCGCGGLLAFLGDHGVPLAGACDAYAESLGVVRRRTRAPLLLVDEGRLPPLGPGFAALGLFDVLEHVDDDQALLEHLASLLRPGGVLVLTVPAHPFLFGEMDELARHRRRYTRKGLVLRLRAAGFEVRLASHFMAPLVPLLLATRLLTRLALGDRTRERHSVEFRVVPGINAAMRALLMLERHVLVRRPLPIGSSVVAVAARPGL